MTMAKKKEEILHIFVIGFHHKKGCQIEFSYPEVKVLPEQWKSLPSLAMPDGAHNYDSDAVYFHLPSLVNPLETIFGVSCFKQIPLEKVKKKTSDMTRSAVQKAVCVLSTVPLYGYIQIKMELVTAAFFEGDFSEVSLLKDAFRHLNSCLPDSYSTQHLHDGLSVRDLVQRFRHRTLLLFKLLLLERRVIFFHSPVKPLCSCLLSLISLHPGVLQKGLFQSSCVKCSSTDEQSVLDGSDLVHQNGRDDCKEEEKLEIEDESKTVVSVSEEELKLENKFKDEGQVQCNTNELESDVNHSSGEPAQVEKAKNEDEAVEEGVDIFFMDDYFTDLKSLENSQLGYSKSIESVPSEGPSINCDVAFFSNLNLENYNLPLTIFSQGTLCLPYVSISYLDFLCREDVVGFIGGAANVLFKQKRLLADVLVELDGNKIETHCPELRRQLLLTTEDLRFGEQLIKGLEMDSSENGEEWIRAQFAMYLLSLLRTSLLLDGSKEADHFNSHFMNAWKNTKNYRLWLQGDHSGIWDINPGHPYAGNLSVADMKLRLSQVMSSSESGRRINQAVSTTGKAVGGAIIQAKGAFTHWWSSLTTSETKGTKPVENI